MKCFGEAVGLPQPKHERRAEDVGNLCGLCLKTIRNMLEIREFLWLSVKKVKLSRGKKTNVFQVSYYPLLALNVGISIFQSRAAGSSGLLV